MPCAAAAFITFALLMRQLLLFAADVADAALCRFRCHADAYCAR